MATSHASSVQDTPSPRLHIAFLDGLRALAALFVVLTHCVAYVQPQGVPLPSWLRAVAVLTTFGHYAVDVFIVLSGFCLALPVVRGNGQLAGGALSFFGKRARRILPPYFLPLRFHCC